MPKKSLRSYKSSKKSLKISSFIRDLIHGYVAGDGFIRADGVLTVEQSQKQRNFVKFLYSQLKFLCTLKKEGESHIKTVSRNRTNIYCDLYNSGGLRKNNIGGLLLYSRQPTATYFERFNTRAVLKGFHNMWYKPGERNKYTKCLPKSLPCFFNSTFLTVWYAADGTKIVGSRGAKFEVTAYTPKERELFKKLFKQKFDLKVHIIRSGKSTKGTDQWAIVINAKQYDKFHDIITNGVSQKLGGFDLISTCFPDKLHKKVK